MKKLLFLFLLIAAPCLGQGTSGSITASGSDCTTAGACVTLGLYATSGSATIQISGTFSATEQFEQCSVPGGCSPNSTAWVSVACVVQPNTAGTKVTSATAGGQWVCNVASMTAIRVRGSGYVSGTVAVTINASPASASSQFSGAAASGTGVPSAALGLGAQYVQTDAVNGKNIWTVTYVNGSQVLWTNNATGQTQAVGGLLSSGIVAAYDMVTPGSGTTLNDVSGNGRNASIGTIKTNVNIGAGTGAKTTFSSPGDGTISSLPIAPGSMVFFASGITGICYDNGSGTIVGGPCSAGTINYATGAYSITFTSAPTNGGTVFTSYIQVSGGPTWATTGLTYTSSTGGIGPYLANISSASTYCALFNQSTNGNYPVLGFSGATTGGNSSAAQFIASEWTVDHTPYWTFGGVNTPATSGSNQYAADQKWHLWCMTANGSVTTTYIDGNQVGSAPTSYTPASTAVFPLSIGSLFSNSSYFTFVGTYGYAAVWSKALTQSDLRYMTTYLSQVMAGRAASVFAPQAADAVVIDGDSRDTNFSAQTWESSYPYQLIQLTGANYYYVNVAIGGQTCVQHLAAAPTNVDPLILGSRRTIVIANMLTNDICLTASNVAVAESCFLSYAQGRKALGAKVFWETVLPRKVSSCTNGSYETDRQTLNTFMRNNIWAVDGLIDVGEDPVIGQSADITNTNYYQSDQTHLISAGNAIQANDTATVLANVLSIPSASNSLIAADIVTGAGWGVTCSSTSACVTSVIGDEHSGTFTITPAGGTYASGTSTITISFSNPAVFQQAPRCNFQQISGTVVNQTSTWTSALSSAVATLTATYNTLPIGSDVYTFSYNCR